MPRHDRRAHRLLEDRHRELDSRLRRRLREVAKALDLKGDVRSEFVNTCAQAAHLHNEGCARADHEFRLGRSSSAEEETARDQVAESRWEEALVLLDAAISEQQEREADSRPQDDDSHYRVRYQPMSRVSRQFHAEPTEPSG